MTAEAAARAQLRDIERALEIIRYRLKGVHATLPPAKEEVVRHLEVEEQVDASTRLRMLIETLLEDKIEPAIRDLQSLTRLREEKG